MGQIFLVPEHAVSMAAATIDSATQWLLLGLGGMVLIALIAVQHKQRQGSENISPGPGATQTQRDLVEVMAQLEQLSRQIHQKIDQRLGKLDALIRLADERIERLNQLERTQKGGEALDIELAPEAPDAAESEDPNQAIYQLADAGYTPIQIARQLSRHTGEVELILSLRRARRASA